MTHGAGQAGEPAVTMEPFRMAVPQSHVDDLRRRLRDTRWQDHVPGSGWTGADLATMRELAAYGADGYDWFTGTGGSSARMYYESIRSGAVMVPAFRDVPLGVAVFPRKCCTRGGAGWVEADHDITQWTELERGGHFAALEEPDLLIGDVRAFFRPLRLRERRA
jgi:hypothetical protein